MPFAEEGIAAGEPVIIGYDDRKSHLLRSWLTDPSAVEFIADNSLYATPARAIGTYQRLFEFHLAMGAAQIRIAGDVLPPAWTLVIAGDPGGLHGQVRPTGNPERRTAGSSTVP